MIGTWHEPVVHSLYGIRVRTPWRVAGVPITDAPCDVEFVEGDQRTLAHAASYIPAGQSASWAQSAVLPDGSHYRRWTDLFEFLVTPNARQIQVRSCGAVEDEAMLAYLLVDALSFSMVRLGLEPLHATAVSTDRGVAAFLGNSGAGKSTLAAAFVQSGARLVTDDMLVLSPEQSGFRAEAGPPRIKLYRELATRIFGSDEGGIPMNTVTEKLIIPLSPVQTMKDSTALSRLYILSDVDHTMTGEVRMERLSAAHAFPAVLAHTAGHYPSEPDRLRRQLEFTARLVANVPIKTLSYARSGDGMFRARDAVLADLAVSTDQKCDAREDASERSEASHANGASRRSGSRESV